MVSVSVGMVPYNQLNAGKIVQIDLLEFVFVLGGCLSVPYKVKWWDFLAGKSQDEL